MAINNDFKYTRGSISISNDGYSTYFTDLSASYPLKLLTPSLRAAPVGVGLCYSLQYGGGLVAGDICNLGVEVSDGSVLLLLTQGSTKVFKSDGVRTSHQKLHATVHPHSTLISLPDPVQPFAASRYKQRQDIHLHSTASAVILDAFTGGRLARGECWDFDMYASINKIFVDGDLLIRDSLLLTQPDIGNRMHPFTAHAMLFLVGEKTSELRQNFHNEYAALNAILNGKFSVDDKVIWSYTAVNEHASVVRLASTDDEAIKLFLRDRCTPLQKVVGVEAYLRCFR